MLPERPVQICSLIAFVALFAHYEYGKVDTCMPVLLLMAADYAIRWWLIARSGEARVDAVERIQMPAGGNVIRLEISHPRIKVDEPGQYCFLRVGQLGHYQWHPFSIATTPKFAADAASTTGRYRFVVFVRDFGDWSRELVRHGPKMLAPSVDGKRLAPVGLDGMYGRIAVPFESYRGVVLVCGGIGCTPMFAVLMHMAETSSKLVGRMVTLVWTFRELELLPAFARELRAARALGWDIRLHHTTMSTCIECSPDTEPGRDDWYRNEHGYCCLQQSLPDQFQQDIAEQIWPGWAAEAGGNLLKTWSSIVGK